MAPEDNGDGEVTLEEFIATRIDDVGLAGQTEVLGCRWRLSGFELCLEAAISRFRFSFVNFEAYKLRVPGQKYTSQ